MCRFAAFASLFLCKLKWFCQFVLTDFRKQPHISQMGWFKIHWNGLSSTYAWFDICHIQIGHRFHPSWSCFKTQYLDLPITNQAKPLIHLLVTQSCNIVHCNWHTQKVLSPICADLQALCWTGTLEIPCANWMVWGISNATVFSQGEFRKQPKFHILLILTGNNALKFLEWCIFKVWGMPNPILQVLSLCDKWFSEKLQFQAKISHFVDFDWEKCIEMAWVVHIKGLRHAEFNGTCCSLWYSGSLKITMLGDT